LSERVLDFDILHIAPPLPLEKVPVNRHRLNTPRIIHFRAVHQVADRINLQRLLQRMPQRQLVRFTALLTKARYW
jgi:anaerobic glycerol-3-phosphate dehydrogenase